MRAQVASNGSSPVWQGMGMVLAQFDGLMAGYNAAVPAADRLTPFQFQQVNAVGDFIDLVSALSFDDDPKVRADHDWFAMNASTFARRQRETTHCSSLIKLDGDFQNLWFAHVAWFAFQATLRIFKHYDFSALANPAVKGGVMSFSSYPMMLSSLDDFYSCVVALGSADAGGGDEKESGEEVYAAALCSRTGLPINIERAPPAPFFNQPCLAAFGAPTSPCWVRQRNACHTQSLVQSRPSVQPPIPPPHPPSRLSRALLPPGPTPPHPTHAPPETTNNIFNRSLYSMVTPESLFAWHRVRNANLLAGNGSQWTDILAYANSGTYNNMYMVLNVGSFTPGAALKPDTLWVVEQIPDRKSVV